MAIGGHLTTNRMHQISAGAAADAAPPAITPPSAVPAAGVATPVAPPPQTASGNLRLWLLLSAGLDARIIDKTSEVLEKEEVFAIPDLAVLRALPRFEELLTAVTRQKIALALEKDGHPAPVQPPTSPLSPDESAPDWLKEAGDFLVACEDGPASAASVLPVMARPAPAIEPLVAPAATTANAKGMLARPHRRSQSFRRRGERSHGGVANSGANGAANGVANDSGNAVEHAAIAEMVCKFYLRGVCHFGTKCRFRHPEGEAGSATECFLCGQRGHKRKDCPLATAAPVKTAGSTATAAAVKAAAVKTAGTSAAGSTIAGTNGEANAMASFHVRRAGGQRRSASFQTSRERRASLHADTTAGSTATATEACQHRGEHTMCTTAAASDTQTQAVSNTQAQASDTQAQAPRPAAARSSSFRRRQQRRAAAERRAEA